MSYYTVLLLYPDYIAGNYGHDTYLAHVEAKTDRQALKAAREEARRENPEYQDGELDDWFCLFIHPGHLTDHNPEGGK